jgi:hypothetical protein
MVVRLSVATCVAVIMLAYPTFSITQSAGYKHIEADVAVVAPGIIGIASTYNPYRPDHQSGGHGNSVRRAIRSDLMDCCDPNRFAREVRRCPLWQRLSGDLCTRCER